MYANGQYPTTTGSPTACVILVYPATDRTRDDCENFVARYGVRRPNETFWRHADWFHEQYAREKPVLSGLFDLNRYRNR